MIRYSAFLLLGIAAPVSAQSVSDPERDRDIVVTATGVAQPADQVGQAITIIDRAEIEQRQAVALSELLATTPGVTVSRNGGLGTVTSVRIRGAEDGQTLVLIDGVRVNDPSSPSGAFDFASLLASSVDRVEVLRGPDSVAWGSQAIGGVVNVITAEPSDKPLLRGNIEYGARDTVAANAAFFGKSGIFSAAVTGGYLRTDGISAAASGTEPDGYRRYGGSARLGIAVSDTVGVDLRAYYANGRTDLDGYAPPTYIFADDPEYSTSKEFYGYAGAHANLLDGRFLNRVSVTLANIDRDNFASPTVTVPSFFARGHSERYEYQGDLRVAGPLRIIAGADHEDSSFFDGASRPTTGITSFYSEVIVTPVRQLTITGGLRHDQHRRFGGHISASVNAAVALAGGTTVRGSYAQGFKAPTLYQLFAPYYGSPTLKPETARNYDVGIAQSLLGARATASATFFHRDTTSQIDFDLSSFTYNNIVRARAEGVEFEISLRPIDALTISANYNYIASENRSPGPNFGKDLARRPRQAISVSADYRLPFGLSFGSTLSHVGDSFDDPANFVRLDGYVLASVRAEMPVGKRLSIYGRIENLFDEKYQTVAGYGTEGRAAFGGVRMKID